MTDRARAVRAGNITAVAHPDRNSVSALVDRFRAQGYRTLETEHFAVCQLRPGIGRTYLMHTFDEASIDDDLSAVLATELSPLDVLASDQDYGRALFAIVASTCQRCPACQEPGHLHLAHDGIMRHYCVNSIRRLRAFLDAPAQADAPSSHLAQFAAVYRKVIEYSDGTSLLDVGSNLGFFSVLAAERTDMTVVGCDNRTDAVRYANDLASTMDTSGVGFVLRDVLDANFAEIGQYDTVACVHLLEHLNDDQTPIALANMLQSAIRRLIISVPYEEKLEPLYGHSQVFTQSKLQRWGQWCVDKLGSGRHWRENVAGGLLVIERQ